MHAFTHSLAHRAPSATRPRVRWQPYNPLTTQSSSSSLSTRSPSSTQISTPTSSVSSPPSNTPLPETKVSHTIQNQKEIPPSREPCKKQFAVGLVDQAVKTLGEIWRPQDIPHAFLTTSRAGATFGSLQDPLLNSSISVSSSSTTVSPQSGSDLRNIVPIKGFVHEVIRRSRTSGCVLQTALCYLEAIRPRIPDLLRKEQSGEDSHFEADISTRILPATEAELKFEEECRLLEASGLESDLVPPSDLASTVRITDVQPVDDPLDVRSETLSDASKSVAPFPDALITPTPTLPSPLLCPRRTFLASLILASKFTQDKCYSNRAWAKLSGLPAREIGRCERALGEALDWRLWVGKTPTQNSLACSSAPAAPSASSTRPVVRCQSESNLLNTPATRSPFLVRQDPRPTGMLPYTGRTLQRSSTMPAEVFASQPLNRGIPTYCKNSQVIKHDLSLSLLLNQAQAPVLISFADGLSQSPSPDNPGLSYSPSSTESSSGDRTIQMSTFIDEPMASYSASQMPSAMELWPGTEQTDSHELRISPLAFTKNNRGGKVPVTADNLGLYVPPSVKGADLLTPGYVVPSSNPSWLLDGDVVRSISLVSQ
ncbi:G1/S-specific cyclin pas1 [Leucoagaricus sp. SymC.cos]|nr:G1/S-specific cyclin pas1 [Leucoagaricus sp. SymC.cos]